MANLAATVAALETYCGFPAARTRQVARRLLEGTLLTPGAPGIAVEINEADFALLLLGIASGATMPMVADATVERAECVPSGITLTSMPQHIRPPKQTAFDVLHDLIWSVAHSDFEAQRRVAGIDVEVVETWPEVALHTAEGTVRFVPTGTLAGHWQGCKQRRSTTIPGSALVDCVRALFTEKK